MWLKLVLVSCLSGLAFATDAEGTVFDLYKAEPVTAAALTHFENAGITSKCTMRVKPCNESEGRRIDGSCNNLKKPSMGTFLVPQERVLPAEYHNVSHARLAADGNELTTPREVRNTLLWEGQSINDEFTQAIAFFPIFAFTDVGSVHDINFMIKNKTNCCEPEHMNDEMCTPLIVKDNDPVHVHTHTRCLNLTKPLDHQYLGCTNESTPAPISESTGIIDLSQLYNGYGEGDAVIRASSNGLLAMEMVGDQSWPPNGSSKCFSNIGPEETRCFKNYGGALLGSMYFTIWFIRNHNYYATELAKVNPCWDDDQLFYAARDLNIATYLQIFYFEWFPTLTGEDYLIEKGLKTKDNARSDVYDETKPPQVTLEFIYIMRYFHTVVNANATKFDADGNKIGNTSITQLLARTGFLGKDDNLIGYSRFLFLQESAGIDHGVDPDIAETGFPLHVQNAADLCASDLMKGRTMGMGKYIAYVKYCGGVTITSWDDLKDRIDEEHIKLLKRKYTDVKDIDLLAGAWVEKKMKNGKIPEIVACLIADYLKKNMISDRFWYQRPNRVGAYNDCQIAEIEKYKLSSLICTNADTVTKVQKHAFKVVSDENPLLDCSEIPSIDFSVFAACA